MFLYRPRRYIVGKGRKQKGEGGGEVVSDGWVGRFLGICTGLQLVVCKGGLSLILYSTVHIGVRSLGVYSTSMSNNVRQQVIGLFLSLEASPCRPHQYCSHIALRFLFSSPLLSSLLSSSHLPILKYLYKDPSALFFLFSS